MRKLALFLVLILGCAHHARPLPADLTLYAGHLKFVDSETFTNRFGTAMMETYNVDQSYDEALAAIQPTLTKAGFSVRTTNVPKRDWRIASFRRGDKSIVLTQNATDGWRPPGWNRVTVSIDTWLK